MSIGNIYRPRCEVEKPTANLLRQQWRDKFNDTWFDPLSGDIHTSLESMRLNDERLQNARRKVMNNTKDDAMGTSTKVRIGQPEPDLEWRRTVPTGLKKCLVDMRGDDGNVAHWFNESWRCKCPYSYPTVDRMQKLVVKT